MGEHQHATSTLREERLPPSDEVEELAPGVRRLQLPISMPGLGHVNCYILDDNRGAALVDPGLPGRGAWKHLTAGLGRAGIPLKRVHTVVVTHSHPDHFGAAGRIRQETGARIITHRDFRLWWDTADEESEGVESVTGAGANDALLEHPDARDRRTGPTGPTPWGGAPYRINRRRRLAYFAMRHGLGGRWFATPKPTRRVVDLEVLSLAGREFVSLHTPGHTIDHLCLHDPDSGLVIAGDHVLPTITPHISGLGPARDPLAQYFASLDRMKELDGVGLVLPAHGHPFTGLSDRVESIKAHHRERLDILRATADRLGRAPVATFMKHLFRERSWGSMAESETYAHLEHLRLSGEVTATRSDDGLVHYEP
ncbi:MAG TPA: MBL fold metallo-hydrolase [Acidimicrobiales bacterium]|nr:MBL fold metallo-hydrolase [Acidimicrobiales bacterium]